MQDEKGYKGRTGAERGAVGELPSRAVHPLPTALLLTTPVPIPVQSQLDVSATEHLSPAVPGGRHLKAQLQLPALAHPPFS